MANLKDDKGYQYAKQCIHSKTAPKYVKKQCREFVKICNGRDKKYCINRKKVEQIQNILKLLNMPKGLKQGQSLYECTCGYQWLFLESILAVVYREDKDKRRYETAILEIARKNFKTYTIATLFILLFLMESPFSEFYSVAPDGTISKTIKKAISETLKASPDIYMFRGKPRFKILRDCITFKLTESKLIPLATSTSRMDSRFPNGFVADEVGALTSPYPIEAMRSGQLNIKNKIGCLISTKYPNANNPFEDEVNYAKRVLDGLEDDERTFALLFEPDKTKNWATDDLIMQQANPIALENPDIWDDLVKKRAKAIAMESLRENFLTKHCNIIYQGLGTEAFVDINDLKKCKGEIDWQGRTVYLGVDLSMSHDNCSVAMVTSDDDGNILADAVAFIPADRIEEKSQFEKIDYRLFIEACKCIACGYKTVDYAVIEDFVFHIEEKYGVIVKALGFDQYNAISSAQKWERGDEDKNYKPITCIQIRQHSDTLHPPTKLLYEKITNHQFIYEENKLLEINFENARCVFDTNMNRYVNKKKSNGKIDEVVAIIDATYLLQQDLQNDDDFVVQVI